MLVNCAVRLWAVLLVGISPVAWALTPNQALNNILPSLSSSVQTTVSTLQAAGTPTTTIIANIADDITPSQFGYIADNISSSNLSTILGGVSTSTITGIVGSVSATTGSTILGSVSSGTLSTVVNGISTGSLVSIVESVSPTVGAQLIGAVSSGSLSTVVNGISTGSLADIVEVVSPTVGGQLLGVVSAGNLSSVVNQVATGSLAPILNTVTGDFGSNIVQLLPVSSIETVLSTVTSTTLGNLVASLPTTFTSGIMPSLSTALNINISDVLPATLVEGVFTGLPVDFAQDLINQLPTPILGDVVSAISSGGLGGILDAAAVSDISALVTSVSGLLSSDTIGSLAPSAIANIISSLPTDALTGVLNNVGTDVFGGVLSSLPTSVLDTINPSVLTNVIAGLPVDQVKDLLQALPSDILGDVMGMVDVNSIFSALPVDQIAGILDGLPLAQVTSILQGGIGINDTAGILALLPPDLAGGVLANLPVGQIVNILNTGVSLDNAASIISLLPADLASGVLGSLPMAANIINHLITFDPSFLADLGFSGLLPSGLQSLIPTSILNLGGAFGGPANQICSNYGIINIPGLTQFTNVLNGITTITNLNQQIDTALTGIDSAINAPLNTVNTFLNSSITGVLGPLGDIVGSLPIVSSLPIPGVNLGASLSGLIPNLANLVPGELLTLVSKINSITSMGVSIGSVSAFGLFGTPLTSIPLINPVECRSNAGSNFYNADQIQMVEDLHRVEVMDAMVDWGLDPAGIDWAKLEGRFGGLAAKVESAVLNYKPEVLDGNGGIPEFEWMMRVIGAEMSSLLKCQLLGPLGQFDPDCMDYNFGELRAQPIIKIPLLFTSICIDMPCMDLGVGYNQPKDLVWTRHSNSPMLPNVLVDVLETIRNESLELGDFLLMKMAIWMNIMSLQIKTDTSAAWDDPSAVFSGENLVFEKFWEFYDWDVIDDILTEIRDKQDDWDLKTVFPHRDIKILTALPQLAKFLPGGSWLVHCIADLTKCHNPLIRVVDEGPAPYPVSMTQTGSLTLPFLWKFLTPFYADRMAATALRRAGFSEAARTLSTNTLGTMTTVFAMKDARCDDTNDELRGACYTQDSSGSTNLKANTEYGDHTFKVGDDYSPSHSPSAADGAASLGSYGTFRNSSMLLGELQMVITGVIRNNKYTINPRERLRCTYDFRDYCPRPGECSCDFGRFKDVIYRSGDKCHTDSLVDIGDPGKPGDVLKFFPEEAFRELAFVKDYDSKIADELEKRLDDERDNLYKEVRLITHRSMDIPHWPDVKAAVAMLPFAIIGKPSEAGNIALLEFWALFPLTCGIKRCDDDWKHEPAESRCEATGRFDPDSPLRRGFSGSCC
jgi:Mg/Co/Ni transporter MgtE